MKWIENEWVALGFIFTACVGGVVGWIKAYEQSKVESTKVEKFWSILRRVIMAGFAGWILYQFSIEFKLSNAWGHILSGVVGMFSAEAFELMWSIVQKKAKTLSGTDDKP